MSYHKIKNLPQKEIQLLVDAIEEVRKDEEKQMQKAQSKTSTIGSF